MAKKLIALTLIAAAAYAAAQPALVEGEKFEAPDDVADKMLADQVAKLDETTDAKTPKAGKSVKVRLLVDSALGNCNDVVEVDATTAKEAESSGLASSAKGEVAYAQSLEQNQP